jgi:VWFA-related protein
LIHNRLESVVVRPQTAQAANPTVEKNFMAVRARRSLVPAFRKTFGLLAVACLVLTSPTRAFAFNPVVQDSDLHFELPANGNLRVENLRGGVIAEFWNESYLSLTAITDSGQASRSPAVIQRTEGLLSVRVPRGATGAARINLELKIPARAHAAILTDSGSVQVRGLPAALLVQTVSGEIRAELPASANADLSAATTTGRVSSAGMGPGSRSQLSTRLGTGGRKITLSSQAGNIAIVNDAGENLSRSTTPQAQPSVPERREQIKPAEVPRPVQKPDLGDNENTSSGAGIPAPTKSGPEEVDEGDVIRVDTQLVSVNVSVVDRSTNRGINDLSKEDFRLAEDNVNQQILHFDAASSPFNLVLLIDLSGSTTKVVQLIKSAALHFVDAARPFDRIGVITFSEGQVVVSPLTTDREALHRRINAIESPQGSTKLYDSVAFAMNEVFREAKDSRRNAIVMMSDGLDSVLPNVTGEGSRLSFEEVIRRAKEFDGVIYSIWTDTQSYEPLSPGDIQQETFDLAHDRMKEVADAGGGVFYECEKLEDLAGAYERVVADLGMVYTLGYRPTNKARDRSWRSIRVNVDRDNTVARGKRGYYAK